MDELDSLAWRGSEGQYLIDIELRSPSSLHRAVQERNIEALKDLINTNVDLNHKSKVFGYTALILAVAEIRRINNEQYYKCETSEDDMKPIKIAKLEEIIKLLLEAGCSANIKDRTGHTPIFYAADEGLRNVVEMIIFYAKEPKDALFHTVAGETLLHVTVRGMNDYFKSRCTAEFNWCLDLFLNNPKINVNHLDKDNNTALHYAALNGDNKTALKLLRHGACVGLRNNQNELALKGINARTLETYLDECITAHNVFFKRSDDDYNIGMDYAFLSCKNIKCEELLIENIEQSDATLTSETDPLLYMSQSEELRPLLKHPMITSFLYLKWHRISCFIYANIATYSILWLFLILYFIFGYGVEKKQSDSFQTFSSVTYVVVIIGLILLIIRELFQLLLSPVRYLQGYENWIEIVLISIITWIVCDDTEHVSMKQQLSAVAILISSTELLLLISQIPALSTNILMLKTVSLTFLKFLLWYSLLIIAFALSFYTLFRQVKGDQTPPPANMNSTDEDEGEEFFNDPFRALFKTIVMLTGEFDAGSIQFNTFPVTSHIIFIVFVFMIPIVLFNLLNGLAVSDIQKIRADAELVALISRVKLISYLESILTGNAKPTKCWPWLTTHLAEGIFLFPYILPVCRILVQTNQDNKIMIPISSEGGLHLKLGDSRLDGKIVQNAKLVISKKKTVTEQDEIKALLLKIEANIASLDTTNKSLQTTNKNLEKKIQNLESLDTTNKNLEKTNKCLETTNKRLETKIENVETILNRMSKTLKRMSV